MCQHCRFAVVVPTLAPQYRASLRSENGSFSTVASSRVIPVGKFYTSSR